jgi:amidase
MLDVLAGTERFRAARPPERPLRIALSTRPPVRGVKADTGPVAAAEATAELLAKAGHEIEAADPPYPPALVWTFLQRWVAGVAEDAGSYRYELLEPRTQRQVQLGRALRRWRPVRSKPAEAWRNRAVDWFAAGGFDALLTPALAKPPVPVGRWEGSGFVRTMLDATAFVPFTAAWNLAGLPSAAVPAGPPSGGCPLGVMLTAPVGGEGILLGLAAQLERLRPWPRQAPPPA